MAISSQSPQSPPPVRKAHGMFHNLIDLVASSIPEVRRPNLRSSSTPMPPPTYGSRTERWQSSPQISHNLTTWTKYTQILIHMYNADIPDPENHGAILHHKENLPEWKGWDVYDAATVRSDKDRIKLQVLREFCEMLATAKVEHAFRQAIRAAEVRMPFSPQSASDLLDGEDELMDELYPGFAGSDEAELYGRWIEASTIDEGSAVTVRQRGNDVKASPLFISGKKINEQVTTKTEVRPTLVDVSTPKPLIPRTAPVNFSVPKNYPQNYPASPPTQATPSNNYMGGRPSDVILHRTPDFTLCYQVPHSPLHHTHQQNPAPHQSLPQPPLPAAPHLVPADQNTNPLGSHPTMMATPSPFAMPPAQYQPQQLQTIAYNSYQLPQLRSQRYKEQRRQRRQWEQKQQQTQQAETRVTISPGGTHYYTPIPPTSAAVSDNTTVPGNAQDDSHLRPQTQHQVFSTGSNIANTAAEIPSTSTSNQTTSSPSFSSVPRQFFLADYQGYGGERGVSHVQQTQQPKPGVHVRDDQGCAAQHLQYGQQQQQRQAEEEQHIGYTFDMMSPPSRWNGYLNFDFDLLKITRARDWVRNRVARKARG